MELQAQEYLISPPLQEAEVPEALHGSKEIVETSTMVPFMAGIDRDAPEWRASVLEPLIGELALGMSPEEFIANLEEQSDGFYSE